ncbi:MAG: tRNA (guanosine(46)-N7)-methyltransferase TrmB [Prolixibacteraceae bacterium]|nr:tRNA (guanosine(46)-N7)-methyltransferase TrmB [Prolixibacteraceae bacterium]MBT6006568.1 tRNA (guanosine(46)-N7)-methyltransferase TrmB [Prolixibacteraceae bacterium]MBT6764977.1 tRNA (guanosine(46)-N7)-methyltransferase TrmB [Prolixibacteraceae bacterium]MBT6997090.1 tRNA (guanosine(46)-N7)-methyltransferase TrmB [Prolixibacteraceae bacterium]MBT7393377.1 tRNA (guanosine(46)-N7)-methyltransferase TrmB [Prolixibacteraceae bacterium]
MGKNKLAKFEEMAAFEHVVQAPYHLVKQNDFYLKGYWAEKFFKNTNPVIVELGCGKGEYTVKLAEKNPNFNYIGVDIKGSRLFNGAKQALNKNLKNVAFLRTNIEIVTQFFGAGEILEIWLTFPDPQMKKTRKRLTSTIFLNKYKQFLKNDGVIHLKTDSNFQYSYTAALVKLNGLKVLFETDNLYQSELLNDTLRIKTFYEKQWLSRGIAIKYLAFELNKDDLIEPEIDIEKDEYRSFGRSAKDIH